MDLERIKAIAAAPNRTLPELRQMQLNACERGNREVAEYIEKVISLKSKGFSASDLSVLLVLVKDLPYTSCSESLSDRWPPKPKKRFSFEYCEQHALAVLGTDGDNIPHVSTSEQESVDFTVFDEYLKKYRIRDDEYPRQIFVILFLTSPFRGPLSTTYARLKYVSWAAKCSLGLRATNAISAQKTNRRR